LVDNELGQLFEKFKEQAEAISARVYRVSDPPAAGRQLNNIIKELNVKKMTAATSNMVSRCIKEIGSSGVTVYTRDLRRHAEDAELGLSEVDLAIAETGTLAQDSTGLDQRLVSSLPLIHVALVRTDRLVNTFGDAVDHFYERDPLPGYIAFISGPSRTADIERVLTIGVHGPEQLHIIFIDQAGGEPGE
jgi:L-lactate dehydrogenase complex protein LldG